MRLSYKTTILVILLALLAVLLGIMALSSRKGGEAPLIPDNPLAQTKAKILAIVSSPDPLTIEEREILYDTLSDLQILKYNFSYEEKSMIVNALNNHGPSGGKKNSSAGQNFSNVGLPAASSQSQ